jgi:hypothetical protein
MRGFNDTTLEVGQRVRMVGDGIGMLVVGFRDGRVLLRSRLFRQGAEIGLSGRLFEVDPRSVVGRGDTVVTSLIEIVRGRPPERRGTRRHRVVTSLIEIVRGC